MKLNHPVGAQAEDRALAFLCQQGLSLVARNWHCGHGEVDLVMKEGPTWVFIEVKYRQQLHFGGAAYSITPHKLAKLQRTIVHYMQVHKIHREACRLDAVLCQAQEAPVWLKNILG
ncbi:MAG: YraN family protein [Neisseriaceae bacterium]|nr:YraN family protein [Neisseriaceae bacterium]